MFMLISNELVKIAHLQKLANQLMLKGAFVVEMVNNSFNSLQARKTLIKRGNVLIKN